jgi:quercetin dioxygenase-like cupin family protein
MGAEDLRIGDFIAELFSEGRTPMATLEYSANNVKTERETAQKRAATAADVQLPSIVQAGKGIPVLSAASVTIELLTPSREDGYWVMKGTLQPGESVSLHSHSPDEDFYLVSGEAEVLVETENGLEWKTVQTGEFVHIPGDTKHAWRNRSSAPVEQIIVTSARLGRFLQELGDLIRAGGREGIMEKLRRLIERYGYWLGSPEEHAAVGISLPDQHLPNR